MRQHRLKPPRSKTIRSFILYPCSFILTHFPAFDKSEAVPYLVAEVASLLAEALVEEDVVARGGCQHHTHAHAVCAEAGNQVQRVGAVAQRLRHLASQFVADDTREIDMAERHFALVLVACHNHTRHPEEDDIRTGYEVGGRVVVLYLFVVGVLYAVEERDRPQPRREPCVQRALVLHQRLTLRFGLRLLHRRRYDNLVLGVVLCTRLIKYLLNIISRNTVSPPQLPRDTPVLDVLQPVAVGVLVLRGIEHDVVVHHGRQRDVSKVLHADEPLQRKPRLDRHIGALRVAYFVVVVLYLLHQPCGLQVLGNLLAAVEAVHTLISRYIRANIRL